MVWKRSKNGLKTDVKLVNFWSILGRNSKSCKIVKYDTGFDIRFLTFEM
jgi:hypothetical protein